MCKIRNSIQKLSEHLETEIERLNQTENKIPKKYIKESASNTNVRRWWVKRRLKIDEYLNHHQLHYWNGSFHTIRSLIYSFLSIKSKIVIQYMRLLASCSTTFIVLIEMKISCSLVYLFLFYFLLKRFFFMLLLSSHRCWFDRVLWLSVDFSLVNEKTERFVITNPKKGARDTNIFSFYCFSVLCKCTSVYLFDMILSSKTWILPYHPPPSASARCAVQLIMVEHKKSLK